MKEDEISWKSSTHDKMKNVYTNLWDSRKGRDPRRTSWRGWEDNIKIHVRKTGCDCVDCM